VALRTGMIFFEEKPPARLKWPRAMRMGPMLRVKILRLKVYVGNEGTGERNERILLEKRQDWVILRWG
jgi:hypothetical protein